MNGLSNTARANTLAALLLLIDGGSMSFQIPAPSSTESARITPLNNPFCTSNTNGVGAIDETGLVCASATGNASAVTKVQFQVVTTDANVGYITAGLSASECILDDNVFDATDTVTVQAGGTITMPAS